MPISDDSVSLTGVLGGVLWSPLTWKGPPANRAGRVRPDQTPEDQTRPTQTRPDTTGTWKNHRGGHPGTNQHACTGLTKTRFPPWTFWGLLKTFYLHWAHCLGVWCRGTKKSRARGVRYVPLLTCMHLCRVSCQTQAASMRAQKLHFFGQISIDICTTTNHTPIPPLLWYAPGW